MNIKRIVLVILTILLMASIAAFAAACTDTATPSNSGGGTANTSASGTTTASTDTPVTPATPTGVTVDAIGKVTWTRVSDTTGYEVEVNGAVIAVKFTNYDLLSTATLPSDGAFTVRVRSVNGNNKSEWGETTAYTYSGGAVVTPSVEGLDGTMLKWTKPTFTTYTGIETPYPVVTVNGTENVLAADAASFDLSAASDGDEISLYYEADGVYYHDSQTIKLVYKATGTSKSIAFAAPENVHMEGDILRFDEVVGANIYYLEDVNNTVTQISGSDVLALSSDREGHFLIKAIWAGNTDLDIENSAKAGVTYFTEEQGAGTAANPFMISSTSHLRFIEYYEATDQAMYYKLANDVAFDDYTPANDEDYSNFYNLGSLSGELDGDGHTIKNIVVYYKDGRSSIFENVTAAGVIKNIRIESTKWRTWTLPDGDGKIYEKAGECAILAYTNNGTIENVTLVSGSVNSVRDGAAGLVSKNYGTIKDCTVMADFKIYGNNEAGAFAIYNEGRIEHCVNYGSVSGNLTVGGIVGRNAGLVTECGNEGKVTADNGAGGIAGYNYNICDDGQMQYRTRIEFCYNKGTVSSNYYAGGIVGKNGSDGVNELGVYSYASAAIFGCYNQGAVRGGVSTGGIAGINHDGSDGTDGFGVTGCYSTGDVTYYVKDFMPGRIYLSVAACTWAEDGSAQIYAHYWLNESTSTTWPGLRMGTEIVNGMKFYYVNMPNYTPAGIIFSRVNPEDGSVWNESATVSAAAGENTYVYYINSDWTSGAKQRCSGLLAGYNRRLNECYYMSGQTLGGTGLMLPATLDGGGTVHGMTRTEMRGIAAELNAVLGGEYFVSLESENKYPVLKWQADDKEAANG